MKIVVKPFLKSGAGSLVVMSYDEEHNLGALGRRATVVQLTTYFNKSI